MKTWNSRSWVTWAWTYDQLVAELEIESRSPDSGIHPIVPVRDSITQPWGLPTHPRATWSPFLHEGRRNDSGMGQVAPPATSLQCSSDCSRRSAGTGGYMLLLVRLSVLFMSCCCYPKIVCGFTRPRPPSRETRMNGTQPQPNTGNWYFTAFPHTPAKPPPTLIP